MFQHPKFNLRSFDDLPVDQDLILMDEKWMGDVEQEWLKVFAGDADADPYPVGYVSDVVVRSVGEEWVDLSWYPNTFDRFHEVTTFLPKSAFITCVDIAEYDDRPRIFVRSEWLMRLHEHPLTSFAMIDAAGVKRLLQEGKLSEAALLSLRDRVDTIAECYPDYAFISFADNVLVKQAWSVGHIEGTTKYTYAPEGLVPVIAEVCDAILQTLKIPSYAVVTQGMNAYSEGAALHRSSAGNHVSLNTLGLPFAQLMSIEGAARTAIRNREHAPAQLYLDATFFRSLRMAGSFDKAALPLHPYRSPMSRDLKASYVATSLNEILNNLKATQDRER